MEWNGGNVRKKPGKDNSLGLVKFMFPNSNNIYLYDTPAKSLFGKDDRAFSHNCIRVEKARELEIKIMDSEKNWNAKKTDEAMNSGKEVNHPLDHKISVYTAYFTAEAAEDGRVAFFPDVYNRNARLAQLLYSSNPK
jgi:murein L,D-transpeptidase YcbB/YkuD